MSVACREILEQGSIGVGTWSDLVGDSPDLAKAKETMAGTREDAVALFERVTPLLGQVRRRDAKTAGFVCGYLASEIGRGALDYASLVRPLLASYPTALLWYGLCSGLKRSPELYEYAGGLGRRLQRDLLQSDSIFRRPSGDIASAELRMLVDRDKPLVDFKTRSIGYIEVELIPCVNVTLRWHSRPTESGKVSCGIHLL
jgi:hypothetical protein